MKPVLRYAPMGDTPESEGRRPAKRIKLVSSPEQYRPDKYHHQQYHRNESQCYAEPGRRGRQDLEPRPQLSYYRPSQPFGGVSGPQLSHGLPGRLDTSRLFPPQAPRYPYIPATTMSLSSGKVEYSFFPMRTPTPNLPLPAAVCSALCYAVHCNRQAYPACINPLHGLQPYILCLFAAKKRHNYPPLHIIWRSRCPHSQAASLCSHCGCLLCRSCDYTPSVECHAFPDRTRLSARPAHICGPGSCSGCRW